MAGTLFVGIDVSGAKNVACGMNQEGTELLRCTTVNDRPGAAELVRRVIAILTSHHLDRVVFGLEATGLLAWHLRRYLTEDPSLKPYHPTVHMFNPKVVAGFKDAYNSLPKTDDVDAWVIADRLRFGRLPKQHAVDERYEALQRLTRARFRLVEDLVREKQRFLDVLFLKFSTFTQESPVGRKFAEGCRSGPEGRSQCVPPPKSHGRCCQHRPGHPRHSDTGAGGPNQGAGSADGSTGIHLRAHPPVG